MEKVLLHIPRLPGEKHATEATTILRPGERGKGREATPYHPLCPTT